jgi:hypothetical protein
MRKDVPFVASSPINAAEEERHNLDPADYIQRAKPVPILQISRKNCFA